MPERLISDTCRDASLRAIVTYKRPCNDCCDCQPNKPKKQQKGGKKSKFRQHKKRSNKCCLKDQSCPQRIEEMALPLNRRIQCTLARYSNVFDTERVLKVCKLIHDLESPKPAPPTFMKKNKKKKRCLRAKACCKSAKIKAQWLEKQTSRSSEKFIKYLGCLRRMIPNYKQLQVTMMLYKFLNFRKLKTCNKYIKEELKVICQKLAILIDVKLQPYKQEFIVDQISATSFEDKHCVFQMYQYVPPESEAETELVYEEEASTVQEGSLYAGEESLLLYGEEDDGMDRGGKKYGEGDEEEEGLGEGESITSHGGLLSEESDVFGEDGEGGKDGGLGAGQYGDEDQFMSAYDDDSKHKGKGDEYESEIEEESYMGGEEEAAAGGLKGFEEEESIMEGGLSEESSIESKLSVAGLLDYHPEGTSSYVDWCLYVSWLKELGRNIEIYASCLQQFKETLQGDEASKFEETMRFILKNWSDYLAESRRVDQDMTQYFKDKPMTWCTMCRDCTIDDYPMEHFIPPELAEVINTTKHWRRLLAEAEEYCNLLSKKSKGEEGEGEVEEEMYEIFDVGTSSSSSFDITPLGQRRSKSK